MGLRLPKNALEGVQRLIDDGMAVEGPKAILGPSEAVPEPPRKYRNEPVVVDGIRFDSKKEARRWFELKALEKSGQIRDLQRQVPFELKTLNGYVVGKYVADFVYYDGVTGGKRVEDAKGYKKNALYQWKKRHMQCQYGLTIIEV